MRPVVKCPAQRLVHDECQQRQLSLLPPQASNPAGPGSAPHWLWDPQIRQRTGPSSGEMDVRPKVEKGQPDGQGHG